MNRFIGWISKFIEKTGWFEWILVVMIAVLTYELIARDGFGTPTIWAHEMSGFIFGALVILAGAYTLKAGGHVSVNIITIHLSEKVQRYLTLMSSIIVLLVGVAVAYRGVPYAYKATLTQETSCTYWNPVLYPIDWVMVIGYILIGLEALRQTIINIRELSK